MATGKLTKDRQYHGQRETDKKTENIMAKWKLKKTDNIMDKGKLTKDRKHQGQREIDKSQTIS